MRALQWENVAFLQAYYRIRLKKNVNFEKAILKKHRINAKSHCSGGAQYFYCIFVVKKN